MKNALFCIAANAVAITCVVVAGYLAANNVEGWGWFLFVGLISISSVSFGREENE